MFDWFKKIFAPSDEYQITVTGINPQTDNEFLFYQFVEREEAELLEKWFEKAKSTGLKFKPQYENAILNKVQTGTFKNPHSFPEYFNNEFDYVAIDFETANNSRVSACKIGLVFVKNGKWA